MKTVTITKKEYDKLKKLEKLDFELMQDLITGIEDIRKGRIKPLI